MPYHQYEVLLAVGRVANIQCAAGQAFSTLQNFYNTQKDWLFGHFAYDLKNEVAPLTSAHPDGVGFDDLHFFQPEIILTIQHNKLSIGGWNYSEAMCTNVYQSLLAMPTVVAEVHLSVTPQLQNHLNEAAYIKAVEALQHHIHIGDCYEVNFCRENFCADLQVNPLALFARLNAVSPAPSAAYYRVNDRYLLCSSPERYVQKVGNHIISQPIKGTIHRGNTALEDAALRDELRHNRKERAENVMVVDLVRNDLSHVAQQGSVHVAELCGIYQFPQVHHMISTVAAEFDVEHHALFDIIRHSFPMGSMTGAPKLRVMQLIEQYERSRRGLYSGAVGYVDPQGNMDFNVVIRSILYNAADRYLSFQAGSAITFYSNPQSEWEECLLKAKGMRKVLGI
ncbi:anthranilate synthase component I family protein [Chitinophaga skermanii]|uniref:anthranilate synthase component I family protein n=1 Tax=Chitinophaga skermanii TaxID=331697 RepID=UPI001FE697FA|nr:anthranilate synthase component I family protein [Chitinophaga skermanii]